MPINLLAVPILCLVWLVVQWTLSEALEKDGQTCLYFIKFSVQSFICVMSIIRELSYIFKEN